MNGPSLKYEIPVHVTVNNCLTHTLKDVKYIFNLYLSSCFFVRAGCRRLFPFVLDEMGDERNIRKLFLIFTSNSDFQPYVPLQNKSHE